MSSVRIDSRRWARASLASVPMTSLAARPRSSRGVRSWPTDPYPNVDGTLGLLGGLFSLGVITSDVSTVKDWVKRLLRRPVLVNLVAVGFGSILTVSVFGSRNFSRVFGE